MNLFAKKKARKTRKGFSLVELVVVILIIAILSVAVFSGGSIVINKSKVSRTTSDLHNFSVAVESFMNENAGIANCTVTTMTDNSARYAASMNSNLAADYALSAVDDLAALEGNITGVTVENAKVFESAKTDAWDNPYYLIMDCAERHGTKNSDFYIYVVSAGPDAKTELCGKIGGSAADKADDIFLLVQYTNGSVTPKIYNVASGEEMINGGVGETGGGRNVVCNGSDSTALYCVAGTEATGLQPRCPVNF